MDYWLRVVKRAWGDALGRVGLRSPTIGLQIIAGQVVIAIAIWMGLGRSLDAGQIMTRIATAASPFMLQPVVFLIYLLIAPVAIDSEQRSTIEKLSESSALPAQDDAAFMEGVGFLAHGKWLNYWDAGGSDISIAEKIALQIMKAAIDGVVDVWGRPDNGRPPGAIPRDYWKFGSFDVDTLKSGNGRSVEASQHPHKFGTEYSDLRLNRDQIERARAWIMKATV